MMTFISFIYNYILDALWIKYDLNNLDKCKIMEITMNHLIMYFQQNLIQI